MNYRVKDIDSKRRSLSTIDYLGMKQEKIKMATISKSPNGRENTTISGNIPNYNLKASMLDKIKPFFQENSSAS